MQLIDLQAIGRLDDEQRKGYFWLLLALAGFMLFLVLYVFNIVAKEYLLNRHYEQKGIHVEGVVSGFRYHEATGKNSWRYTGHYPNVTFSTPEGTYTLKADSGKPLEPALQTWWLGRKVDVVYLQGQPEKGRVTQWPRNTTALSLPFLFLSVASLAGILYFASQMWPRTKQQQ